MNNDRTYFITWAGDTHQVYPLETEKLKYVWTKEKGFVFRRKKLNGKLTFGKGEGFDDFTLFRDIDLSDLRCAEIKIEIYRDCNNFKHLEWKGYFSMQMCYFDLDNCIVSTTAEPDDQYRCIFDNWETTYNMFEVCSLIDTGQTIGSLEQCTVNDHSCFTDPLPCAGMSIGDMHANGWIVTYHIAIDAPVNECDPSCGDDAPCYRIKTIWSRQLITLDCIDGSCDDVVPPDDGWVLVDEADCECEECCCCFAAPTYNITFRGALYNCLIENTVTDMCSSISELTSLFLNQNPDTSDPLYDGGNNYVTGNMDYAFLMISQKSDIVNYDATNPATVGNYTFKQLLDWARVVLNCYWDLVYDSQNNNYKLRIEHLSFYENMGVDIDLTDPEFADDVRAMNKYDHLREELPSKETFKFMEAIHTDFQGLPITYSLTCTHEDNEETYEAEDLTTDVQAALLFPDQIDLDGFYMIMVGFYFTSPFVKTVTGKITGIPFINGGLSWANLHYDLHRHGRVLKEGVMNGDPETFFSFRENTRQSGLKICYKCRDFDPLKQVQTELGEVWFNGIKASIQVAEQAFINDQLSLTLLYQYSYQERQYTELLEDGGDELLEDGGTELLE